MKKAVFLVLFMATLVTPAYAAETGATKGFFDSFLSSISNIFSGDFESSESTQKSELGPNKTELLKVLNKLELNIRVSVSGRDIYLQREVILTGLNKFSAQLEDTEVSTSQKKEILGKILGIEKILTMDLTEKPQDKVRPYMLESLDYFEELVFDMSEEEAGEILRLLNTSTIAFNN